MSYIYGRFEDPMHFVSAVAIGPPRMLSTELEWYSRYELYRYMTTVSKNVYAGGEKTGQFMQRSNLRRRLDVGVHRATIPST